MSYATSSRPVAEGTGSTRRNPLRGASRGRFSKVPAAPLVTVIALALLALPLLVGVLAAREPRWYPSWDIAETELKVRDTWSADPPLVGLGGRIGPPLGADQGSHPGPVSFYALAPVYRLLGSTAWGLQVATVVLQVAAMAVALWLVGRRRSVPLVLGVAAVLALLIRAYGMTVLTIPWNPYLPVLWWVTLLVAVWAVTCDDLRALPVVVFAASFCMQTHVPYGVPALAVSAVALVATVRRVRRRGLGDAGDRRLVLGSLGLGVAMWALPVTDQFFGSGNVAKLYSHFAHPPEAPMGVAQGVRLLLRLSDPSALVGGHGRLEQLDPSDPILPGLLFLTVWITSVVVAVRLADRPLIRLHLVLGVAVVAAAFSLGRIFGFAYPYLTLWGRGLTAMLLVAVVWTALAVVVGRRPAWITTNVRFAGVLALSAVIVVASITFTVSGAVGAPTQQGAYHEQASRVLAGVTPGTMQMLARGVPGTGPEGLHLVTWGSPDGGGINGMGLVNELTREGYDVGVANRAEAMYGSHRLLTEGEATVQVHLSSGSDIELWRSDPLAVEAAYVDPRTDAERAEYEQLRASLIQHLRNAGKPDLVPLVDESLNQLASAEGVPPLTNVWISELSAIGRPTAVFMKPIGP